MPSYDVTVRFLEDPSLDKIEVQISAPQHTAQVDDLLARFAQHERYLDLPSAGGKTFRVHIDSIIRIYSQNRNNFVCVSGETIRTTSSVNDLASKLGTSGFLRVSRFEIINLEKVVNFDFSIVGELKINLEDDQTVYASRRYIPIIRDYLKGGDVK